jgi:tetratricopeptide (TPR) repeat protein
MRRFGSAIAIGLLLVVAAPQVGRAQEQGRLSAAQVDRFNTLVTEAGALLAPSLSTLQTPNPRVDRAKVARAIKALDEAIGIYPDRWQTWWTKGKAHQSLGQPQQSYEAFRRAYALAPREQAIINEMTIQAVELGDHDAALRATQAGLADFPDDLALRARLALVLLLVGKVDESISAADRALEVAPGDSITSNIRRIAIEVKDGSRRQPRNINDRR